MRQPVDDRWTDRLSEYLDDELSPEERREVDAHLRECETCTVALAELQQVAALAAALPAAAPDRDLWAGVARRIDAGRAAAPRLSFTLPQLAAAALVLMAGPGWLALRMAAPPAPVPSTEQSRALQPTGTGPAVPGVQDADPAVIPASFADAQYDAAVADLEGALRDGRGRLDPTTVTVLEENLALIDRAIDEARQALETDPASTYVSRHLMQTRRAKLDLLRHATALTTDYN
jgi:hypothetical protein